MSIKQLLLSGSACVALFARAMVARSRTAESSESNSEITSGAWWRSSSSSLSTSLRPAFFV